MNEKSCIRQLKTIIVKSQYIVVSQPILQNHLFSTKKIMILSKMCITLPKNYFVPRKSPFSNNHHKLKLIIFLLLPRPLEI